MADDLLFIYFLIFFLVTDPGRRYNGLRNGIATSTQGFGGSNQNSQANLENRRANGVNVNRGLHETFEYYDDCNTRSRNMGTEWVGGRSERVRCDFMSPDGKAGESRLYSYQDREKTGKRS